MLDCEGAARSILVPPRLERPSDWTSVRTSPPREAGGWPLAMRPGGKHQPHCEGQQARGGVQGIVASALSDIRRLIYARALQADTGAFVGAGI